VEMALKIKLQLSGENNFSEAENEYFLGENIVYGIFPFFVFVK
jgi:hypothetical protein